MKKSILMIAAIAVLTLTSCKETATEVEETTVEAVDSVEVEEPAVEEVPVEVIDTTSENLEDVNVTESVE